MQHPFSARSLSLAALQRCPVAKNSAAIPARNSLVLIGKFLLPFFVAHFAAEFTVKPAFIVPLPLNLSASKIQ
jgi:hypothetical protein